MVCYTREEKVKHIIEIVKKLKNYPTNNGDTMNIYNDDYSFVKKLKDISFVWITNNKDFNGLLYFEEIDKYFRYHFPNNNTEKVIFSLQKNNFFNEI